MAGNLSKTMTGDIEKALREAYEAGRRDENEAIAKLLEERTQHDSLFVPRFLPNQIRQRMPNATARDQS